MSKDPFRVEMPWDRDEEILKLKKRILELEVNSSQLRKKLEIAKAKPQRIIVKHEYPVYDDCIGGC